MLVSMFIGRYAEGLDQDERGKAFIDYPAGGITPEATAMLGTGRHDLIGLFRSVHASMFRGPYSEQLDRAGRSFLFQFEGAVLAFMFSGRYQERLDRTSMLGFFD